MHPLLALSNSELIWLIRRKLSSFLIIGKPIINPYLVNSFLKNDLKDQTLYHEQDITLPLLASIQSQNSIYYKLSKCDSFQKSIKPSHFNMIIFESISTQSVLNIVEVHYVNKFYRLLNSQLIFTMLQSNRFATMEPQDQEHENYVQNMLSEPPYPPNFPEISLEVEYQSSQNDEKDIQSQNQEMLNSPKIQPQKHSQDGSQPLNCHFLSKQQEGIKSLDQRAPFNQGSENKSIQLSLSVKESGKSISDQASIFENKTEKNQGKGRQIQSLSDNSQGLQELTKTNKNIKKSRKNNKKIDQNYISYQEKQNKRKYKKQAQPKDQKKNSNQFLNRLMRKYVQNLNDFVKKKCQQIPKDRLRKIKNCLQQLIRKLGIKDKDKDLNRIILEEKYNEITKGFFKVMQDLIQQSRASGKSKQCFKQIGKKYQNSFNLRNLNTDILHQKQHRTSELNEGLIYVISKYNNTKGEMKIND